MYAKLMMDYIQDDHDHDVSVVSLSVQIFTVPSLVRVLIKEQNAFEVVIKPFMEVAEDFRSEAGYLTFQQLLARSPIKFRRSLHVLNDFRYLLTSVPSPEEWDNHLENCILVALRSLLDVVCCVQGMDPVVRQVGAHQEFTPEWETAFTIQLRLNPILALFQQWCSTNHLVALRCFSKALSTLNDVLQQECKETEIVEIAGHQCVCIVHDVSSRSVSIHIALPRLVAGLYLSIMKFCFHHPSASSEFTDELPKSNMLELPVRAMALCAQIHNYFASICRSEMFDKDILMLQICASIEDADSFLIAVLYKFGLRNWARYDRQRFIVGVGKVECSEAVRKEIIHLLCRKPMTFSKLERHLPEDPFDKTGLEDVINSVAIFKPPKDGSAGQFELKPECLNEYNPFFWHYSKSEMSEAEDYQRRLRAHSSIEIKACPPPVLPEFCKSFAPIIKIFESDVFLFCFTSRVKQHKFSNDGDIYSQMISLVGKPNVGHTEDLLQWTITKFMYVLRLHTVSTDTIERQTAQSDVAPSTEEQNRKKRRHEIALKQRQKAVEQIEKMQNLFIEQNKSMLDKCKHTLHSDDDHHEQENMPSSRIFPVCVGPNRTSTSRLNAPVLMCVLCQDEQQVTFDSRAIVYAAFVQNSSLFTKEPHRPLTHPDEFDPLYYPASLYFGVHTSSCGHTMHADCWQQFYDNLILKEQRNHWRHRLSNLFNIELNEYLCPLCKRLCNTVLPALPSLQSLNVTEKSTSLVYEQFISEINDWLHTALENGILFWSQQPKSVREIDVPRRVLVSTSIEDMLRTFSQTVYSHGLQVEPHFTSPKVSVMNWLTLAYTIRSIDAVLIFDRKPLFGALSTRRSCELYGLVHCVALSSYIGDAAIFKTHLRRLLLPLFASHEADPEQLPNVLNLDIFTTLVELSYTIDWMKAVDKDCSVTAHAGVHEHHLLRLMLSAYMLQLLFTANSPAGDEDDRIQRTQISSSSESLTALLDLRSSVYSWASVTADSLAPIDLLRFVTYGLIKFLRPVCLFLHALSSVDPPEELCEFNADHLKPLCRYLDIPSDMVELIQFLDTTSMERWCKLPTTAELVTGKKIIRQPVLANDLIVLPQDFSTLINQASQRWYSSCFVFLCLCLTLPIKEPRYPALCLVCGEMVCSRSYCCQRSLNDHMVGGCTYHANHCSGGTGIFLSYICFSIRDCQIVLLYQLYRGCFLPAPYVDEYGETDQGFRRGKPLLLSAQLYQKLRWLWLNHSVPEQIVNRMELSDQLLAQEWFHF
ncbi:unnamed protein product [Soboliphyme baturini]|uniref:E3 ubiquitin-protein ligase n=1 Tax=Soboliphyme baturini TaxID=241478 RepID=A0A183IHC4_9BILA|nr:unnamed protein product [Soboliphyme baturini]